MRATETQLMLPSENVAQATVSRSVRPRCVFSGKIQARPTMIDGRRLASTANISPRMYLI